MVHRTPTVLIVLDGFGYTDDTMYNPINLQNMPYYFSLLDRYSHTLLRASGISVGLLEGMSGNSLVGHMTLGAGRIVEQPISVFHHMIQDNGLMHHKMLCDRFKQLRDTGGTLHLMGLLSDGASHSHEELLYSLLRTAHQYGIRSIVVHPFLDGRDAPPRSAGQYLAKLDAVLAEIGTGAIGTVQGRSFAMDRTDHIQKITPAFEVLTQATPVYNHGWHRLLEDYYARGITDEFIPPTALLDNSFIKDGDGLIFFNIRADRARSLTSKFLREAHPKLLWFITAIRYHPQFSTDVLYEQPVVENTLPDVLRAHDLTSCYIAETEKYAHVNYFFNGGKDIVSPQDMYVIVPSPAPDKFKQHPELASPDITVMACCSLKSNPRDFYLINYANADIVGHTGDIEMTAAALRFLDRELSHIIPLIVDQLHGTVYLTADHGKAEHMFDVSMQQPHTRHTRNLVPFMAISQNINQEIHLEHLHELADVAPYILQHLGLSIPPEMKRNFV